MSLPIQARRRPALFLARLAMMLVLSFSMMARPAMAQSVLRDAETEALFREMSRPIIEASGLSPRNVDIVLLHDRSINAFVAGGQIVYVHSGLITAADNVNEVQGVIAHELGHITGGHILRAEEGQKQAMGIMLLSLVLGAAAMAAGASEAGAAAMAAGQQAAMSKYLAFSRVQESSADQAGASYLTKSGVSGKGMIAFFKKLQNLEFRLAIPQEDSFARTHPLSGERIQELENVLDSAPSWNAPLDPQLQEKFERVKAKLVGYVEDSRRTLVLYPETNRSIAARYARAYAWHKGGDHDRAQAEIDALLRDRPRDPFFLELKGQMLLESGRAKEAIAPLREATNVAANEPLIASLFGHALISTEDPANFEEAKRILKAAIGRDNTNPFAWYQLGIVYDREGDPGRAALATAERYNLEAQPKLALANAEHAMLSLPNGTPDYLRAQDIAMVSRTAVERDRRGRNGRN